MGLKMLGKKAEGRPKIIAIAAGKGGVGKSAVTANLALALTRLGYRVGIIDADLYGPSLRRMLPEECMPEQEGNVLIPAVCHGIELISMGFFKQDSQATLVRAPIANQLITRFLTQVRWSPLDYLLIDFPPGTGDIHMTLSQRAELCGALLVTTPQQVAILDVKKCIEMFEQVKIPLIGIVENMSYYMESTGQKVYPLGRGGGKQLAQEIGELFLDELPLHPLIGKALDEGRSLFEIPGEEAEKLQTLFLRLAEEVASQANLLEKKEWTPLKAMREISPYAFEVKWADGSIQQFRLSDLQRACPCAACVEEETGRRRIPAEEVPEDLRAIQVETVGRYALRIQFESGCSRGIYGFDYLKGLKT